MIIDAVFIIIKPSQDTWNSVEMTMSFYAGTKFILIFTFIYLFGSTRSLLWHVGSNEFPNQGSNPGPLHWECGVSAAGPPKSLGKKVCVHNSPCDWLKLQIRIYWYRKSGRVRMKLRPGILQACPPWETNDSDHQGSVGTFW